jgi:TolB protein
MKNRRWKFLTLAVGAFLAMSTAEAGVTYTSLRDGLWQVVHQDQPTSAPQVVGRELGADASAPSLSPDGQRVAFEVPGQGILICPVQAGAGCQTLKTDIGSAVRPTWDRSGELVFVRYVADTSSEESEILTTQNGLRDVRPLVHQTGNQDNPDLSPDGRLLVYDSAQTISLRRAAVQVVRHLWIMELDTGVPRLLVAGAQQDIQPDWSPDGQWIAFASDRSGDFEIWVVRADGSGLKQVTSGPGTKTWPAWSPDGKKILYTRSHEGKENLWLVGVDGSGPEPFGAGADAQLRDADWR